ncbi:MAG: hypothetical protein QMD71_06795 [bacterium]|nr:hypothetical protein [bacterium]
MNDLWRGMNGKGMGMSEKMAWLSNRGNEGVLNLVEIYEASPKI